MTIARNILLGIPPLETKLKVRTATAKKECDPKSCKIHTAFFQAC